jgi:AcrR family transcriptional regulator
MSLSRVHAMADVKPTTRKARAAATRQRITESAYRLFLEQGYAATTMPAVAAASGVAVQTVYFTFRTKGDLLQAVYERVVLGPDAIPPHLMPWWPAAGDGHEIEESVRRFARGTAELLTRAAPLVWMVLGDETAREGYEHNERLRQLGYAELIPVLADKHPLRAGLTRARARDLLLVLTGPQLFVQCTRDLGWTEDEFADWATAVVLEQVFGLSLVNPGQAAATQPRPATDAAEGRIGT